MTALELDVDSSSQLKAESWPCPCGAHWSGGGLHVSLELGGAKSRMKMDEMMKSISNMTGSPLSFFLKLFPFQCFQKLSWRALCRILTFIRVWCSQFDHSLPLPLTQKFLHPQISESFLVKSPLSRQWRFCWSRTWAKDSAWLSHFRVLLSYSMLQPLSKTNLPSSQEIKNSRSNDGWQLLGWAAVCAALKSYRATGNRWSNVASIHPCSVNRLVSLVWWYLHILRWPQGMSIDSL